MNVDYNMTKLENHCINTGQYITPSNICYDMVSMLDNTGFFDYPDDNITQDEYINSHRVLDIYCKSGNFLYECYKKFMRVLRFKFPDKDDRDYFIWRYLLFAFTPDIEISIYLRERFYLNPKYNIKDNLGNIFVCNIVRQDGLDIINKTIKVNDDSVDLGAWKNMKFDVVIGNPPFNGGIYIDFCNKANKLSKRYVDIICPSHWRLKFETNAQKLKYTLISNKHLKEFHMFECNPDGCTAVFGKRNEGGAQTGSVGYYLADLNISFDTIDVYESRYVNGDVYKWNSGVDIICTHRSTTLKNLDVFVTNNFTLSILNKVLSDENFVSMKDTLEHIKGSDVFGTRIFVTNCLSTCTVGKHTTLAGFFIKDLPEDVVKNIDTYFHTKFWRMLNRALNSGYASCDPYMYKFYPKFDFNQVIDDDYIADYYGFTKDERAYIASLTYDRNN